MCTDTNPVCENFSHFFLILNYLKAQPSWTARLSLLPTGQNQGLLIPSPPTTDILLLQMQAADSCFLLTDVQEMHILNFYLYLK